MGKSTRERILDASERLFLDKGYDGVSIRDITERAGVNVAAINYHFGGKDNLYLEVLRRRLVPHSERRISALRAAIKEAGSFSAPDDLKKVIRTFVSSFLGELTSDKEALRFLDIVQKEISTGGIASDMIIKDVIQPIQGLIKQAILSARPSISEEKAALCCVSITGQIFQFVRGKHVIKRVLGQGYEKDFPEKIIDHIVDFSIGGIG